MATNTTTDGWYLEKFKKIKANPQHFPEWKIKDDGLFFKLRDPYKPQDEETAWKEVVPADRRDQVLRENHDAVTAGHPGIFKTYKKIAQTYFWPKLRKTVVAYVKSCKICQEHKHSQARQGFLIPRSIPGTPFEVISVDLIGALPRSARQNEYLVVIQDLHSKYVYLKPIRRAITESIIPAVTSVFLIEGAPRKLICDNGSQFTSALFHEVIESYKTEIEHTPSRHAQANPVERANKEIKVIMSIYVRDNHRTWDNKLSELAYALNTTVKESTGFTPVYLAKGREISLRGDRPRKYNAGNDAEDATTETISESWAAMENIREIM